MKKASKIILTIAGVFNLLALIAAVIVPLVYCIMALVSSATIDPALYANIQAAIEESGMEISPDVVVWVVVGIYCLIVLSIGTVAFVYYLVCTIISFKGAKAKKKGVLIANIVFYCFTWYNILMLVGAILGIIGLGQEARREQELTAEPEPVPVPAPAPAPAEEPAPAPVVEEPKPEPQPEPKPERKEWECPNCGAHTTGKFCPNCGTKKPE